jgi:GDP/UDP-N,N'-diacetylbacillosamine 2-epimerase (hydrolysing)
MSKAKSPVSEILFITGSRSDFATIKRIFLLLNDAKSIQPRLFVTGPHTLKIAGETYRDIQQSGIPIAHMQKIKGNNAADDFATEVSAVSRFLRKRNYSTVIVTGDRPEMLAAATSALLESVPVVHIHGGDVTYGMADDSIRHAITKIAAIHFAATPLSAKRIRRLGEEPWRIHQTGSPDVDELVQFTNPEEDSILRKFDLPRQGFGIALLHPETLAQANNAKLAAEMLVALERIGKRMVIISPNNDPYSDHIRKTYEAHKNALFLHFASLNRTKFLTLLKNCEFLIGNSSSGIIEAATFKVPVINLGHRQDGRQRNSNVIDVPIVSASRIIAAYNKSQSVNFQKLLKKIQNIYGRGNSSKKIANLLTIVLGKRSREQLLYKRFSI